MVKVSDVIGKDAMPSTPVGVVLNIQKNTGVKTIAAGIEWDAVKDAPSIDLDIWLLLLNSNGVVDSVSNIVYYKNRSAPNGCAYVTEDNRDGSDKANKATLVDDYDEIAVVNFDELPQTVSAVIVGVSIDHTAAVVPAQKFENAPNAKCIVYDFASKSILAKCQLTSEMNNFDAVIIGKYARSPDGFTFESIMKPHSDGILGAMKPYGIN